MGGKKGLSKLALLLSRKINSCQQPQLKFAEPTESKFCEGFRNLFLGLLFWLLLPAPQLDLEVPW